MTTITITLHRPVKKRREPDRIAAGIAWVTPQGQVLLLKRAEGGDHPGTWAFPAGGIEHGETGEQAAARELAEETQQRINCKCGMELVWQSSSFSLFMVKATKFSPILNHEHEDFVWAPLHKPPGNLHPHVAEQLQVIQTHLENEQ